jgi:transcriptional regulator with XRE-family HTH domain
LTGDAHFEMVAAMKHALHTYRKANKLTLADLSAATGLSKSTLCEIEKGRHFAGRRAIIAICAATGLLPNEFLTAPANSPTSGVASPSVAISPDSAEEAFSQQGDA